MKEVLAQMEMPVLLVMFVHLEPVLQARLLYALLWINAIMLERVM
jgi:hypothetical protein